MITDELRTIQTGMIAEAESLVFGLGEAADTGDGNGGSALFSTSRYWDTSSKAFSSWVSMVRSGRDGETGRSLADLYLFGVAVLFRHGQLAGICRP
jgi:hypothetical protein